MYCSSKSGSYGKGILNDKNDVHKTERIGRLGEIAYGKLFNCDPDLEYRRGGDKYDFLLGDKKIDVKTSAHNHGNFHYVVHSDDRGHVYDLRCDIYIFFYLVEENYLRQTATIGINGYMTKFDMYHDCEIRESRYFNGNNYCVPKKLLKPITDLYYNRFKEN
jgi:hypothetical protein